MIPNLSLRLSALIILKLSHLSYTLSLPLPHPEVHSYLLQRDPLPQRQKIKSTLQHLVSGPERELGNTGNKIINPIFNGLQNGRNGHSSDDSINIAPLAPLILTSPWESSAGKDDSEGDEPVEESNDNIDLGKDTSQISVIDSTEDHPGVDDGTANDRSLSAQETIGSQKGTPKSGDLDVENDLPGSKRMQSPSNVLTLNPLVRGDGDTQFETEYLYQLRIDRWLEWSKSPLKQRKADWDNLIRQRNALFKSWDLQPMMVDIKFINFHPTIVLREPDTRDKYRKKFNTGGSLNANEFQKLQEIVDPKLFIRWFSYLSEAGYSRPITNIIPFHGPDPYSRLDNWHDSVKKLTRSDKVTRDLLEQWVSELQKEIENEFTAIWLMGESVRGEVEEKDIDPFTENLSSQIDSDNLEDCRGA